MEELGLTRIPFYSELTVFNRKDVNNDITALVLSVMLYWHSLDKHQRFNARNHVYLLARNLRANPEAVKDVLEYLTSLKLLDKRNEVITTESENPDKKTKLNEFYVLNFHNLHEELKKHSLNIPIKILRMASDDFFDLYSYISPLRLPKVQGLVGMIKGEAYDIAALNACKIICSICSEPEFEDFSYKALAPGWRMLAQPPATPEDLVERYKKEGERSVDIDLTDGAFFMPDGDCFGTEKHKIWHSGKQIEPRILATALYLCFTAVSDRVEFYSDLNIEELSEGFKLLYRFTGLKGRLSMVYFNYKDYQGEALTKAQKTYEQILSSLNQTTE